MSDVFSGCTVIFEKDIKREQMDHIKMLIRCIRGIASVTPIAYEGLVEHMARERVFGDLGEVFFEIAMDLRDGGTLCKELVQKSRKGRKS